MSRFALPASLAPDDAIDLQMHTTFSDGVWSAEDLLAYVAREGFALVAVTDHDRVDSIAEVQRLAAEHGVCVLPAVEISSEWEGNPTDLLCFGVDPERAGALAAIAADTWRRQAANIAEVYAALTRLGYRFPDAQRMLAAHDGQPRDLDDVVKLLEAHGYADGVGKAVRDAGFRWMAAPPERIVEAAHACGALCLIAHPGRDDGFTRFDEAALDRFRALAPVDGLEISHPTHAPEQVERFRAYAEAHDLLVSAGSDSHGKPSQMPIKYPAALCGRLLERLGITVE